MRLLWSLFAISLAIAAAQGASAPKERSACELVVLGLAESRIEALEERYARALASRDPAMIRGALGPLVAIDLALARVQEAAWAYERAGLWGEADALLRSIERTLLENEPVRRVYHGGGGTQPFLHEYLEGFSAISKRSARPHAYPWLAHEPLAYGIDRVLRAGVAPVTVQRRTGDGWETLQYFVRSTPSAQSRQSEPGYALAQLRTGTLNFLDYLLLNLDRHGGNYLVRPCGWVIGIDHNRCLGAPGHQPIRYEEREIWEFLPRKDVYDRFVGLGPEDFAAILEGNILDEAIEAFEARRQRVAGDLRRWLTEFFDPMTAPEKRAWIEAHQARNPDLETWRPARRESAGL